MGEIFRFEPPHEAMEFTGERLTTTAKGQVEIEHLHRYFFAREICRGLDVADIACGEGYGTALLAQTGRSVLGIEIDLKTVQHARKCYQRDNVTFVHGDARRLPIRDDSLDVVVSFETIEHFTQQAEFLSEVARVLRPSGLLVVSSPDRDTYSPLGSVVNPYHHKELTRSEFTSLLRAHFPHCEFYLQRPMIGSALVHDEGEMGAARHMTFERRNSESFEASTGLARAIYLVAVASKKPVPCTFSSLFIDSNEVEMPTLRERQAAHREQVARAETATALLDVERSRTETEQARAQISVAIVDAERSRTETEQAKAECAVAIADAERSRTEIVRVRAELAAALADAQRSHLEVAQARAQADTAQREVGHLRIQRDRAIAAGRRIQARASDSAVAATERAYAASAELVAEREHRLAMERKHEQLQHEIGLLGQLAAERDIILHSTLWRVLSPMRSFGRRFPRVARTSRRAAKLAWWTVTLQVGSRLRARRALQRQLAGDAIASFGIEPPPVVPPSDTLVLSQIELPRTAEPEPEAPAFLPTDPSQIELASIAEPEPEAPAPSPSDLRTQTRTRLAHELNEFLAAQKRLVFVSESVPRLSILVVVFNQAPFTFMCLRALAAERDIPLEVIVVDNASTDETARVLDAVDNIQILRNDTNLGFVKAVNQAATVARGEVLVLLNNDAVPRRGALAAAVATLRSSADIGAVGGRLVLPDGCLQEAGSIIWRDGTALGYARGLTPECPEAMFRRDVDFCSGAFLITPRGVFEQLCGFDERYAPAYYEEADYCMRLRQAKLRVVYEPGAVVDHFEFASEVGRGTAAALMQRNHVLFRHCHAAALARDHLPPALTNALLARTATPRPRELLVLDDLVPLAELGAGFPRAKEILNRAAALGWGVCCYAMQTGDPDWSVFRAELDPRIEIVPEGGFDRLTEFLEERRGFYDVVMISRPHNMMHLERLLDERPDLLGGARLIYDAEAVYAHRVAAECALKGEPMTPEAERALLDEEIRLAQRAETVLAVSPVDAKLLGAAAAAAVHVLTNAPAIPETKRSFSERQTFLFVGRLREKAAPNYEGLSWFIRTVWPLIRANLPDARLVVVGLLCDNPNEIRAPGVALVGKISDLRELYEAARVFIAPARFAAGIPLKVVEAAAAGVPVVSSQLLAEQLQWQDGDELLVASDPERFAELCCAAFEDSVLWQRIRSGALRRIATEYSPSAFDDKLRSVLDGDGKPVNARAIAETDGDQGLPTTDTITDAERISRVNTVWGTKNAVWFGEAMQWMSHPLVIERNNKRASNDPDRDAYGRLKIVLGELDWNLPVARAASLCCGTGSLERGLMQQGFARSIIGYDVARGAIEEARRIAKAERMEGLSYEVRDLEREGLSEVDVEIVFALSGLHHLARLEECFDSVHAALRPGGVFHIHEYVGPNRFQWTDRQLAEINAFLEQLPERYRRLPNGELKPLVRRPTMKEMLDSDPSEAIRSSEIEPLLGQRFKIIESRELGGSLLHMALSNIAQNFDPDVAEDRNWLIALFDREDRLLADGVLKSDFTVITAQRTAHDNEKIDG